MSEAGKAMLRGDFKGAAAAMEEERNKGDAATASIKDYLKNRDQQFGGADSMGTVNPNMISQMKQTVQERGANLTITPGSGEGTEDSQFKSDPTTGDIRMKMPGSWVTIRKDDFKNSVSGVVTEALTKGT